MSKKHGIYAYLGDEILGQKASQSGQTQEYSGAQMLQIGNSQFQYDPNTGKIIITDEQFGAQVDKHLPEPPILDFAGPFDLTHYLTPTQPATLPAAPGSIITVTPDTNGTLTHNGAAQAVTANTPIELTATGNDALSITAGQATAVYNRESISMWRDALPTVTGKGAVARVEGALGDMPMDVVIRNHVTQSGTPSFAEPVPFEGVLERLDLWVRGKNIINVGDWAWTPNAAVSTSLGNIYASTGNNASGYIPVRPGMRLTPNFWAQGGGYGSCYTAGKTWIGGIYNTATVLPDGAAYIRVTVPDALLATAQIEVGEVTTASPYTPPRGYTLTRDLGVTLYGLPGAMDEIDLRTGVILRRTWLISLTGSEPWNMENANRYNTSIASYPATKIATSSTVYQGLSTHTKGITQDQAWNGTSGVVASGNLLFFGRGDFVGIADWRAALAAQYAAGTPVQVLYELATPIYEQLDPATLAYLRNLVAISGTTTAWSNAREIELVARMSGAGVRAELDGLRAEIDAMTGK